jgi:hypothetical protein
MLGSDNDVVEAVATRAGIIGGQRGISKNCTTRMLLISYLSLIISAVVDKIQSLLLVLIGSMDN